MSMKLYICLFFSLNYLSHVYPPLVEIAINHIMVFAVARVAAYFCSSYFFQLLRLLHVSFLALARSLPSSSNLLHNLFFNVSFLIRQDYVVYSVYLYSSEVYVFKDKYLWVLFSAL